MTKKILQSCLTAVLILMVQTPILAQAGPARAELERFALELKTLQASFDQQVIGADGEVESQSSGRVWLKRPQLFRWEYEGDFPELLVADGTNIWLYDEMLEQVTVKEQSSLAADSPLTLLTNLAHLDEQFEVRELGVGDGVYLLELKARSQEAQFDRVLLGLQDGVLLLMAMEDVFGLRTEIRFHDIQRNAILDMALFTFVPPQNADVIGEVPDGFGEQ